MPCYLTFEYTDEHGRNPTQEKITGEFEIDFDFIAGAAGSYKHMLDNPAREPVVEILSATCSTATTNTNKAVSARDRAALAAWFQKEIGENSELRQSIRDQCIALVNFECDDDNLFD